MNLLFVLEVLAVVKVIYFSSFCKMPISLIFLTLSLGIIAKMF